ncbi:MAG: hypothetical protein MJ069_06460 [Salinivirgaceae bacterium]|nr:hypothetical protein [Salinivirgaceae bacterium]
MSPIFETTTAATTYTAIPAAMNLEPGMQYCWRVTVFDPSGKAVINKNGQSEVREFTYLHTCPAVDEVSAEVHNARVDFSWTPSPYHTHFQVELVGDNGVSELNDCYDSQFKLYDFPRGSTWKVRVRGECSGGLEADWSPWSDFEIDPPGTPPTPEECPNCGCDDTPKPRTITNYELKELHEGDTIENRTGRTRFIVLTAVPNGDGSYNGQFYLWLELWKTKVRCDYTDLKVNTDGVIFDGQWRSVRNDGLMVSPKAIAATITDIRNNTATVFYDNSIRDTLKLSYTVQTIYKDQNDNYIAVLQDGTEKNVTPLLANAGRTMVEDAEGNKMVVTSDHRLMSAEQYHNTGKNSTLIKNDNERKDKQIAAGEVVFSPSSLQTYGFDAYNETSNNYPEIYSALEGGYRPAYKSIAQWQTDKILADPMDGVTFRNNMGVPYAKANGEILLRGEPQPGETLVYAHVAETDSTTKVVGKLNLLTFEPREINVCFVPVNGATPPNAQTLEKELNKIFKPAVASVKLSTATPINIQYANGSGFVHGGSGLLSVYSEDEKNAIKTLQNADNDTYYLFVVDNVTRLNADGTPMKDILAGYMPIGRQHGFLFGVPAAKYVAHELGHGAFGLHHTFSSETESFSAPQYSTDNLMDYADGIALNHKQWTWMHEKHGSGLFGFLADESEGEWTTDGHYYLFTYLGMLMGMSYGEAEELGRYAEEPDTHVITEDDLKKGTVVMGNDVTLTIPEGSEVGNMLENTTWLIGGLQQRNHALTGGYHGVELAATAYAITKYPNSVAFQKYLLHRFGDVFAHFEISNDSKGFDDVPLQDYIDAVEKFVNDKFIFTKVGEQILLTNGTVKVLGENSYFQMSDGKCLTTYSNDAIINKVVGSILCAENADNVITTDFSQENLLKYLPEARQNTYKMYGDDVNGCMAFTLGHTSDGSEPDEIIRRSNLFMLYVKRATELLEKFGAKGNAGDAQATVQSVVDWGKSKNNITIRLDGIFALQIALLDEKPSFKIPIKNLPEEIFDTKAKGFYIYYKEKMHKSNFETDTQSQIFEMNIYMIDNNVKVTFEKNENYWICTLQK